MAAALVLALVQQPFLARACYFLANPVFGRQRDLAAHGVVVSGLNLAPASTAIP